jgi:hypothetical protein
MHIIFKEKKKFLSDINTNDKTYKISEKRQLTALKNSISDIGLINPPFLMYENQKLIIVSGFHRIAALDKLNVQKIIAKIIIDTKQIDIAKLAISENSLMRNLNFVEQARALSILKKVCPNEKPNEKSDKKTDEKMLLKEAHRLNLPNNINMIYKLLKINEMPDIIKQGISNDYIALPTALMLFNFSFKEKMFLSQILNELKLSLSKQRHIITLLKEIAAKNNIDILKVFEDGKLKQLFDENFEKDKNFKANALTKRLNEMRYPSITKAFEKFNTFKKGLKLNPKITLKPPANFEGKDYEINMKFKNKEEIKKHKKDIEVVEKGLFL